MNDIEKEIEQLIKKIKAIKALKFYGWKAELDRFSSELDALKEKLYLEKNR